jgi:hypothetical protein
MMIFASLVVSTSDSGNSPAVILFIWVFLLAIFVSMFWKMSKKTKAMLRASDLSQANGFSFTKGTKDPFYPGFLFSVGDTKNAWGIVEGTYNHREFKIFNYSYMQGHGRNRSEHDKGVVMVKLPRKLPNVIFDSKSDNFFGMSSLGASFSRGQKFTLEGDFNNHFDVYAPQNYGLDVLYFITPELMALLVDEAGKFDIEVVDDNLFFYGPEFDFTAAQLTSIFKLIDNIGGEFSENTQRYADERIGDRSFNMVAEPGRRLKRSISWVSVAGVAIYIIFQILSGIWNGH